MVQINLDGEVPWFFISHVVQCTQIVPFFRFLIHSIANNNNNNKTLINASVKVIHKRIVFVVTPKKNNKEINYKQEQKSTLYTIISLKIECYDNFMKHKFVI